MNHQSVHVAIAILYRDGQFLMQLRDDIPSIRYPGCWGLFGGHLEPGETPLVALNRELMEEIGYVPPASSLFGHYPDAEVFRYIYHAPLLVEVNQLVLGEGWDMALVKPSHIRQGSCYSEKAGQVRPLASLPQRILLDFMAMMPGELTP